MKKYFTLLSALLLITTTATAQGYRGPRGHEARGNSYESSDYHHMRVAGNPYGPNEISVSLGIWPVRPNVLFDDDYRGTYDEREAPVEISIQYMRHLTKRFSVGLDFTYIPVLNEDNYYSDQNRYYNPNYRNSAFGKGNRLEEDIFVIMPTVRFEWVKLRNFSMYSRVSAGLGLEFDRQNDKTHSGFAFQAVPVGMLIGRQVYARIEFPAYGYQGLLTAGFGYKF